MLRRSFKGKTVADEKLANEKKKTKPLQLATYIPEEFEDIPLNTEFNSKGFANLEEKKHRNEPDPEIKFIKYNNSKGKTQYVPIENIEERKKLAKQDYDFNNIEASNLIRNVMRKKMQKSDREQMLARMEKFKAQKRTYHIQERKPEPNHPKPGYVQAYEQIQHAKATVPKKTRKNILSRMGARFTQGRMAIGRKIAQGRKAIGAKFTQGLQPIRKEITAFRERRQYQPLNNTKATNKKSKKSINSMKSHKNNVKSPSNKGFRPRVLGLVSGLTKRFRRNNQTARTNYTRLNTQAHESSAAANNTDNSNKGKSVDEYVEEYKGQNIYDLIALLESLVKKDNNRTESDRKKYDAIRIVLEQISSDAQDKAKNPNSNHTISANNDSIRFARQYANYTKEKYTKEELMREAQSIIDKGGPKTESDRKKYEAIAAILAMMHQTYIEKYNNIREKSNKTTAAAARSTAAASKSKPQPHSSFFEGTRPAGLDDLLENSTSYNEPNQPKPKRPWKRLRILNKKVSAKTNDVVGLSTVASANQGSAAAVGSSTAASANQGSAAAVGSSTANQGSAANMNPTAVSMVPSNVDGNPQTERSGLASLLNTSRHNPHIVHRASLPVQQESLNRDEYLSRISAMLSKHGPRPVEPKSKGK